MTLSAAINMIGANVMIDVDGATLLGDVRNAFKDSCGVVRLCVAHFNGNSWPFDPCADDVKEII